MAFSKGLEGVVAAETKMSFIDGEGHPPEYVGIPIGELASSSTFEETVFLLWNTRHSPRRRNSRPSPRPTPLPRYDMPAKIEAMLTAMPKDAQPMHVMRTLISSMEVVDPHPNNTDLPGVRDRQ